MLKKKIFKIKPISNLEYYIQLVEPLMLACVLVQINVPQASFF